MSTAAAPGPIATHRKAAIAAVEECSRAVMAARPEAMDLAADTVAEAAHALADMIRESTTPREGRQ